MAREPSKNNSLPRTEGELGRVSSLQRSNMLEFPRYVGDDPTEWLNRIYGTLFRIL